MPIRSTFVFWPQALKEPERLLDDLSEYTSVNTIELGSTYATSGIAGGTVPAGEGQYSVIASSSVAGVKTPATSRSDLQRLHAFISLAESRGFKVACNLPSPLIPTRGKLSMSCINIEGGRVDPPLSPPQPYAKPAGLYGCPNNPDVVAYSEQMTVEIAKAWAPAQIITINHVEFPLWPGRTERRFVLDDLFSCFCPHCEEQARAQGIDFPAVRRDAAALHSALTTRQGRDGRAPRMTPDYVLNWLVRRPSLVAWLAFRSASMTRYVERIVAAGREAARECNPKLQFGLEFQLPALSNLSGTDFVELAPAFDFLVPKFPDYLTGNLIPIVAEEIAARRGAETPEEVDDAIRGLLDLGPGPKKHRLRRNPTNMLYDVPYDVSVISRQARHLAPVMGKVPLHPYFWLEEGDAELLGRKIRTAEESGMEGYFIWQWEKDLTSKALKERKGVY